MTPTEELKQEFRELVDEPIPEGGTEKDTRFTDAQINRLLSRAKNIYSAVSEGWTMKAGMLSRELGQIDEYAVGQERYRIMNLQTAISGALTMAKRYAAMAQTASSVGSIVLKAQPPEVL